MEEHTFCGIFVGEAKWFGNRLDLESEVESKPSLLNRVVGDIDSRVGRE